jgi:hypothetical protein
VDELIPLSVAQDCWIYKWKWFHHPDSQWRDYVRCAFLDRNLHSVTPLVPTPARFKLVHACDQWHSSRVSIFLPVHTVNCDFTLKAAEESSQIEAAFLANKPQITFTGGKDHHEYTIVFNQKLTNRTHNPDEQLGCAVQSSSSGEVRPAGRWLVDLSSIELDSIEQWAMLFPRLQLSIVATWHQGYVAQDYTKEYVLNMFREWARCAFLDRNLHSRMTLGPTPAHLKLLHACD